MKDTILRNFPTFKTVSQTRDFGFDAFCVFIAEWNVKARANNTHSYFCFVLFFVYGWFRGRPTAVFASFLSVVMYQCAVGSKHRTVSGILHVLLLSKKNKLIL